MLNSVLFDLSIPVGLQMVTANILGALLPHTLSAVTSTLPPADPTVATIELDPLEPDHVAGNVQVC